MTGAGVFLKRSGTTLYVGDARYFATQMRLSTTTRTVKRMLLIKLWAALAVKAPPRLDRPQGTSDENMMCATHHLPYRPVGGTGAMGIKPLHVLDRPSVWSATLKVAAGAELPERINEGVAEYLVISGEGQMADGTRLATGDYVREGCGSHSKIHAGTDLELFVTSHGCTEFRSHPANGTWRADHERIQALLRAPPDRQSAS